MAVNTAPIYTLTGDVQGGDILTTQSADYTGQGILNVAVFASDATNGGYVQRVGNSTDVSTKFRIGDCGKLVRENGAGRFAWNWR